MPTTLSLCSSCQRHIRSMEPACPFCNAEQASAGPRGMFPCVSAGAAALATVMVLGCSGLAGGSNQPVYGGPVCPDTKVDRGAAGGAGAAGSAGGAGRGGAGLGFSGNGGSEASAGSAGAAGGAGSGATGTSM